MNYLPLLFSNLVPPTTAWYYMSPPGDNHNQLKTVKTTNIQAINVHFIKSYFEKALTALDMMVMIYHIVTSKTVVPVFLTDWLPSKSDLFYFASLFHGFVCSLNYSYSKNDASNSFSKQTEPSLLVYLVLFSLLKKHNHLSY